MAVHFKLDDEGHLVWDCERGEEITMQEASVIATASIGNMLYGINHALADLAQEFTYKKFYNDDAPQPAAKSPQNGKAKKRRR